MKKKRSLRTKSLETLSWLRKKQPFKVMYTFINNRKKHTENVRKAPPTKKTKL